MALPSTLEGAGFPSPHVPPDSPSVCHVASGSCVAWSSWPPAQGAEAALTGPADAEGDPSTDPLVFYNSASNGTSLSALWAHGEAAVSKLAITPADRVCIPITLNHAMGSGFGLLAALQAGAAAVLPSPTPDADTTFAALQAHRCTLLLADTHTLNALPNVVDSSGELPAFRGGLLKVGSGNVIGEEGIGVWGGRALLTVGRKKMK